MTECPAIRSYRFAKLRAGQPQGIAPTKNDTTAIRAILHGLSRLSPYQLQFNHHGKDTPNYDL